METTNKLAVDVQGLTATTAQSVEESSCVESQSVLRNYGFVAQSANTMMETAYEQPNPVPLWGNLWYEGEISCLFADSNVGKSIYAVQIAEYIARSRNIIYFDFELSDKQFQLRYTSSDGQIHHFPENLYRATVDNTQDISDSRTILNRMLSLSADKNADTIIIDNISALCNSTEKGEDAGVLMNTLMKLKLQYGLSILVLAHTPKRNSSVPISPNDLAGSKRLFNFFDSVFAIGKSATDEQLRYIKQLKVRNGEFTYTKDNVLVCSIEKEGSFLQFKKIGVSSEREHLSELSENKQSQRDAEIVSLHNNGKSIREISKIMQISKSTVGRVVKEYNDNLT